MMLLTVMFSESPATPGRKEHMPRMTSENAGLRGAIKGFDHAGIDERVELCPNRCRPASFGVGYLGLDQLDQLRPDPVGRNRQLFEVPGPGITGDEVEHPGRVAAQRRVAGKERQVGIDLGGDRMIVAGPEMHVGAQDLALAPRDCFAVL